jgi:Zn-finger nucleic acid-binding protein
MKCPVCKEPDLLMAERLGVGIDYCPACRGVWLEKGKLDALIERAGGAASAGPAPQAAQLQADGEDARSKEDDEDGGFLGRRQGQDGRRRSWLGDIGNFFD